MHCRQRFAHFNDEKCSHKYFSEEIVNKELRMSREIIKSLAKINRSLCKLQIHYWLKVNFSNTQTLHNKNGDINEVKHK